MVRPGAGHFGENDDTKRIHIIQEFVDLYQHEQMVAFFEFRVGGPKAVAGLCRVSKQKAGGAGTRYLSLTFMIDAPDEGTRAVVDEAFDRIEDAAVQAALPAVVAVVPIPVMVRGAENYVRQVDVMLKDDVEAERPFVAHRLLPVLCRLTDIDSGRRGARWHRAAVPRLGPACARPRLWCAGPLSWESE